MECPKCDSDRVEELPPNQISPRPGYRCRNCGAKLRDPKMGCVYFVVLALGLVLGAVALVTLVIAEEDWGAKLGRIGFLGMCLLCSGYAVAQLMRPTPRRTPKRKSDDEDGEDDDDRPRKKSRRDEEDEDEDRPRKKKRPRYDDNNF
jgi:hypothetical protein